MALITRRRALTTLGAAVAATLAPPAGSAWADSRRHRPRPLWRAHAHNDYEHPRPLLDALDHRFGSVEADIFLVGDQLLIGHTVLMLPYAVRVTGASLALADPFVEEAARGLGASPLRAFFTVTLPLLRPGIFSAALLSFVTSFNNVPLSLLLQSRDFRTLPVTMLDYVQQSYDPMVAATSTIGTSIAPR